mgnify:CR=1 FL=1
MIIFKLLTCRRSKIGKNSSYVFVKKFTMQNEKMGKHAETKNYRYIIIKDIII